MASNLTLLRLNESYKRDSIHGELFVNGLFFCHTIERLSKAIPKGCYPLGISYSPKFRRKLPYICVPRRKGIRIHCGNTSEDSKGCILVGQFVDDFHIKNSRLTLEALLPKINDYSFITIK